MKGRSIKDIIFINTKFLLSFLLYILHILFLPEIQYDQFSSLHNITVMQNHQSFFSILNQDFLELHRNHLVHHFAILDLKILHNLHLR